MWFLFAILSALLSGSSSVISKLGIKKINSLLAITIRTFLILIIYSLFLTPKITSYNIELSNIIYIFLSSITSTLLWIFYFKSLKYSKVSILSSIDRLSIILTIILSIVFLNEKITIIKILSSFLILIGTSLIINKKEITNYKWIKYIILTIIFTSTSSILDKIGINNMDTYLFIIIKTSLMFIILLFISLIAKLNIKNISKTNYLYLSLSALVTSFAWIFYYLAINIKEISIIFTIEKLNIVVTFILSPIIFKENMNLKKIIGLLLLVIGTILLSFT